MKMDLAEAGNGTGADLSVCHTAELMVDKGVLAGCDLLCDYPKRVQHPCVRVSYAAP
jgi:hypothetical protein